MTSAGGRWSRDRGLGSDRDVHPLRPIEMARVCRRLARDLRREHAAGMGPINLTGWTGTGLISRADAARSMDAQAERWERECATGERNMRDRRLIGED